MFWFSDDNNVGNTSVLVVAEWRLYLVKGLSASDAALPASSLPWHKQIRWPQTTEVVVWVLKSSMSPYIWHRQWLEWLPPLLLGAWLGMAWLEVNNCLVHQLLTHYLLICFCVGFFPVCVSLVCFCFSFFFFCNDWLCCFNIYRISAFISADEFSSSFLFPLFHTLIHPMAAWCVTTCQVKPQKWILPFFCLPKNGLPTSVPERKMSEEMGADHMLYMRIVSYVASHTCSTQARCWDVTGFVQIW